MKSTLAWVVFLGLGGCAVEQRPEAERSELASRAMRLAGAYHHGGAVARTFEGIVFQEDGVFFADLSTGARIAGTFTASGGVAELAPRPGEAATEIHGAYRYVVEGSRLSLARTG